MVLSRSLFINVKSTNGKRIAINVYKKVVYAKYVQNSITVHLTKSMLMNLTLYDAGQDTNSLTI